MEGICPKMTDSLANTFQIELLSSRHPQKTKQTQFLLSFSKIFAHILKMPFLTCSECVWNPFGMRSEPVRNAFGTRSGLLLEHISEVSWVSVRFLKQIMWSSSFSGKKGTNSCEFRLHCAILGHLGCNFVCVAILGAILFVCVFLGHFGCNFVCVCYLQCV